MGELKDLKIETHAKRKHGCVMPLNCKMFVPFIMPITNLFLYIFILHEFIWLTEDDHIQSRIALIIVALFSVLAFYN